MNGSSANGTSNNVNGNGSMSFRYWLPLWLFLAVQAGGGIWWMATVSADVRSLTREVSRLDTKHEVLDLKYQRLNEDFARFEERVKIAAQSQED